MTLVYDLRTMQVLFPPPDDAESLEIRVMPIAEALGIIGEEQRRLGPKWKRYYSRHRERHLRRQRHYRATHRDQVRAYNRRYYRSRKMRHAASREGAGISPEVAVCST